MNANSMWYVGKLLELESMLGRTFLSLNLVRLGSEPAIQPGKQFRAPLLASTIERTALIRAVQSRPASGSCGQIGTSNHGVPVSN